MDKFNPSYIGLGELLASPEMQAAMREKAAKIKAAAEATSPVGPLSDDERTRYRDAWEVESGVREEPSRRAYAKVSNPTPYAAAIEWGNGRTKQANRSQKTIDAHYTLTRAIDAARE